MLLLKVATVIDQRLFLSSTEWTAADASADDAQLWEDNWDDDTVEDDFSKQLK